MNEQANGPTRAELEAASDLYDRLSVPTWIRPALSEALEAHVAARVGSQAAALAEVWEQGRAAGSDDEVYNESALNPYAGARGRFSAAEDCQRCGGENTLWFAPSPLWNLVMRGNDILGDALYGDMVCVPCFIRLAAEAGVSGVWRVTVDPEPEGLVKTTPSGRVWDETANLWVDA